MRAQIGGTVSDTAWACANRAVVAASQLLREADGELVTARGRVGYLERRIPALTQLLADARRKLEALHGK